MIRRGEVTSLTDIALDGHDEWHSAGMYPELQRYLSLATSSREEPSAPASPAEKTSAGPLIAAVILIVIAVFLTADSLSDVINGFASRRWPAANGQLVNAHTLGSPYLSRRSRSRRRYNIHVSYRYSVGGREFFSQRYGFGRWRWWRPASAEGAVRRIRTGPLRVHYDPGAPWKSVVRPGVPIEAITGLAFGLVALAAGGMALFKPEMARRVGRKTRDLAAMVRGLR